MMVAVQSPETHPHFTYREMAEGARFENPPGPETIGPDLHSAVLSQSLTGESEADEAPMKPHETR